MTVARGVPGRLLSGAVVAGALTACGALFTSSDPSVGQPAALRVAPGRCPHPGPSRSSAGAPDAIAPGAPAWTTFCIYGQFGRPHGRVLAQAR